MSPAPREEYFSTQVMTAAPQRLQLMLIEAAIQAARRAQTQAEQGWDHEVSGAIQRSQAIVVQLLAGMAVNREVPLVEKDAAVYSFIYRRLVDANLHRSVPMLNDALSILEIERETWRQVCDQRGSIRHQPHVSFRSAADHSGFTEAENAEESGVSFEA